VKTLLRYFPLSLVSLFLGFFGYFAWNYHLIVDDFQFQTIISQKSIYSASIFYYENFNGRLASHFFLFSVFRIFQGHENLFFIYHFLMLAGFVFSLAHFLRNYLESFRNKIISFRQSLYWSLFITAFLFFFFFEGRVELWFWISATGVYLISFILVLNAFAFALRKNQTKISILLSTILFFLAGGFSESYALMYLMILSGIAFFIYKKQLLPKNNLLALFFGMLVLIGALIINISSPGIHNRLGWLPEFRFLHALKNTLHSLAFPFLRYKHLPFVAALTGIFFLFSHFIFSKTAETRKINYSKMILLLFFISISFFIPCYLLTDVVPDRAASLGYFVGVLFLFDQFIFSSRSFPNPQF
jgi:hypothetical protein